MDPHERFYRRSLRDVLVSQGVLAQDQAEELVVSAREANEPFGCVLVDAGYLTAWDLAKTLAAAYQMPILPLAGFQFEANLLEGLSPAVLFQYRVFPVGRFGRAWSFAVVEPPSHDLIEALRASCGNSLFFFAAETAELQRLLNEHVKVVDVKKDTSWTSVFDAAEQALLADQGGDGEVEVEAEADAELGSEAEAEAG
jgi:hypothetical protein